MRNKKYELKKKKQQNKTDADVEKSLIRMEIKINRYMHFTVV